MSKERNNTEPLRVFEARRQALLNILNDPVLKDENRFFLAKYWPVELAENVDNSVQDAMISGFKKALIVQFDDAYLGKRNDAEYVNLFFSKLGVHVSFKENRSLDVNAVNVSKIVSLPELLTFEGSGILDETVQLMPSGSLKISHKGQYEYLVLETKIEGVRIIVEGTAVSDPENYPLVLRPMILLEIGNASVPIISFEEEDYKKKTWEEIHGRDPRGNSQRKTLGERIYEQAIEKGLCGEEMEAARDAGGWVYKAKSADKILVTPAVLKKDPVLSTKEDRLTTVTRALKIAVGHQTLLHSGEDIPSSVIGITAQALSLVVDLFEMTPQEIMRDGEAMGVLVEYLKEVAMTAKGTYGHSSLLKLPREGHPIMELVYLIEDTWKFPATECFKIYDRTESFRNPNLPKTY